MAMADVFIPELASDDLLTPFPRAPPPSPEMQPRSHSRVFEIPASKFEGIGLDLRRNTFQFDEDDECPLGTQNIHYAESPSSDKDEIIDDPFPGSPQKRVCCSPSTMPRDFMTTAFPSSNCDSLVSSGFGSYQTLLHNSIPEEGLSGGMGFGHQSGSHSQSNSPPYFGSKNHKTSPHLIPHRIAENLATPTNFYPPTSNKILSRSYDLHHMHPHLPHSFEATQLPEVRPTRSRTLDSTSPSHDIGTRPRSQTLDVCYGEDPTERKRKISIKRKNPDEYEGDSSLQFCFDYSYSSTGSSGGDSDWIIVDRNIESTWPIEKKACCADDPSLVTIPDRRNTSLLDVSSQGTGGVFSVGRGVGLFVPSQITSLESMQQPPTTGISPFTNILSRQQGGGVVRERVDTPSLQSMDSVMECEGRLDSLDLMDCEQMQSNSTSTFMDSTEGTVFGEAKVEGDGSIFHYQPEVALEQVPYDSVIRSPRSITSHPQLPLLRHSCLEKYLQAKEGGQGSHGGGAACQLDAAELDSRLSLSKSL